MAGETYLPLGSGQRALWSVEELAPGTSVYNIAFRIAFEGSFDAAALRRALDGLVDRHGALRAVFRETPEGPGMLVLPALSLACPSETVDGVAEERRAGVALARLLTLRREPFDLASGPLIRCLLLRFTDTSHHLLGVVHHLVFDGGSFTLFADELATLYRGGSLAEPALSPASLALLKPAADGAERRAGDAFWRTYLGPAPRRLEIPTDRPRWRMVMPADAVSRHLGGETARRLEAAARALGTSPFRLLFAAFGALACRTTGERDAFLGMPFSGRPRQGAAPLVGMRVNTLPVAVRPVEGEPFSAFLGRTSREVREVARHQEYLEPAVAAALAAGGSGPRWGFSLVFSQLVPDEHVAHADAALRIAAIPAVAREVAPFDLTVYAGADERQIRLLFEYATDVLDRTTVERTAAQLEILLAAVLANPETGIDDLPLLGERERHQLLVEDLDHAAPYPGASSLIALFAGQVRARPEAVAVVGSGQAVTYGALAAAAGRVARRLGALGVGLESPVGLACQGTLDWVTAILGTLAAGGFYIPLDASSPAERLAAMLAETGTRVVVSRGGPPPALAAGGAGLCHLDLDLDRLGEGGEEESALEAWEGASGSGAAAGSRLAYVIFTSGSTGRPKGTGVPQRAVARLVLGTDYVRLGPGDRVAQSSSMAFDSATFEVWGALLNGATLVEMPREVLLVPWRLAHEIRCQAIDTMFLVTAVFHELVREAPAAFAPLRELLVGGEALSGRRAARVLEQGAPGRLLNAYGPTESTTFATWHRVTAESAARPRMPIGRAVANSWAVVCDPRLVPVPVGVVGELCLGGDGLARGYLGRPELTAERFVPSPLAFDGPGGRAYRTGDLVRRLPAGEIEYLGRRDSQVKLRGFRIELGEVEAALLEHPAVAEAVVALRQIGNDARLVAWVVPRPGSVNAGAAPEELGAHLRRRLPEAMIPGAFVTLEALPLTPTGKVDRRSLPAPGEAAPGAPGSDTAVAPRTAVEAELAALFAEVLERRPLGVHDDFFALGGHSLLGSRLLARVRHLFGVELGLRALFEAPTAAALGERVRAALGSGSGMAGPPLVRRPRAAGAPASFAQRRLWLLDRLFPGLALYNIPSAFALGGAVDVAALERALAALVRRHEGLASRFAEGAAGEPVQEVLPPAPWPLPLVDLAALPADARRRERRRQAEGAALRPFDLASGPLLSTLLLRLGEEEHELLLTVHHIAADGWSLGILHRELGALYGAERAGRRAAAALPEPELRYADFAAWQRAALSGEALAAALAAARARLGEEVPVLELPADRPRPAVRTFRGRAVELALPAGLAAALRELGRGRRATPAMTFLAGFLALLGRLSGDDRVLAGMPVAGRGARQLEGIVGLFVNTLVMVGELADDPPFEAFLERVRGQALAAYADQDLPFERLVEELNPERDLARSPLVQVVFAWQNAPMEPPALAGLAVAPLPPPVRTTRFDLELHLREEEDGGVAAQAIYDACLYDATTVERLLSGYARLLAAAAARPEAPVGELALLSPAEHHQLLVEDADRRAPYPAASPLAGLFAAQARRTPGAVALVASGREVTYAELDRRSWALARRLRALGVGAESAVGLSCSGTLDGVVGILGSLRAGGFYVPLDADSPAERLAGMVGETGMVALVSRGGPRPGLPHGPGGPAWVDLDDLEETEEEPLGQADDGPEAEAGSRLAYVIYTSGSTGRPKGIGVPQRAVARLVLGTDYVRLGPGDRVAQASNMGFDAATFEVWGALLNGATLVEVPREVLLSPWRLAAELPRLRVDAMFLTAALFHQLARQVPEAFATVRDLLVGGEALESEPARRVLERGAPRRLWNAYGPTESTTFAYVHPVTESAARPRVPIGRAIANTWGLVCDRRLVPVPTGVVGELCLGGDGLARGYHGRPEQTAERFVPSPAGEPGARVYRTGDLVRRLAAGEIEYLGRTDHQVKLRGFRIEPAEVEAALRAHPGVADAVVALHRDGGDPLLAAWVVPRGTAEALAEELRRFLGERLPAVMIPAAFAVLPALPLSSNGKLDRAALPPPGVIGPAAGEAPLDPLEAGLAALWSEVLELPRVGRHDDFFALGGHSLRATVLVSRIRDHYRMELPLRAVFDSPTVAGLAEQVRALEATAGEPAALAPPLAAAAEAGAYPLSFAQERLWFLDRLAPGHSFYNLAYGLRLTGVPDRPALAAALAELVRRHGTLRTTFPRQGGRLMQRVSPPGPPDLPLVDLAGLAAAVREGEAERLLDEAAGLPFSLAEGPLWRAALVRLAADEHLLALCQHHILSDGWSMSLFHRELGALYAAFAERRRPRLPEALQYADYARWQRRWLESEAAKAQLAYWRGRLAGGPPPLPLPTDRPRPAVPSFRGAALPFHLPAELVARLAALGRGHGITLPTTLLAGFLALLSRLTGAERVWVGSPVAGRTRTELEGVLGFLANHLVMEGDLRGDPTFRGLLQRVGEMALGAYSHQDFPFDKLVEELQPERDLSRNPLVQVVFSCQSALLAPPALPGLAVALVPPTVRTARFDLELHLREEGAEVTGFCAFATDLFDGATVERLLGGLTSLLTAAAARADTPVSALPVEGIGKGGVRVGAGVPPLLEASGAPDDPGGVLAEAMVEIWAEVLEIAPPSIGREDNFFALGGHSLQAGLVVSMARDRYGVELPLNAVYATPTVSGLVGQVEQLRRAAGVPEPVPAPPAAVAATGVFPLSFAQQRLWFLDRLAPAASFYNMAYAFRLSGELDLPALAAALTEVARRHGALRTTFPAPDGEPVQAVAAPAPVELPAVDLGALAPAPREAEAGRLLRAAAGRPFDLVAGPLWRPLLLRLAPDQHLLALTWHHIVSDGWSVELFHRELGLLYGAGREGRRPHLPEPMQYADYAAWQRLWLAGEVSRAQLAWWRGLLGGDPGPLDLPADRPRPSVQSFRGAALPVHLPAELVARLRALGRGRGATLSTTLLASFLALLSRVTGEERVRVAAPVLGRPRPELEEILGFFVNTLVMEGDLRGDPGFLTLVARVGEMALGAYAHQDLPFERLVEELAPQRDLSRNPLAQVLFSFQNAPMAAPDLPGLAAEVVPLGLDTARFDLELHGAESEGAFVGFCAFATDLFDRPTVARLLRGYRSLLSAVVAEPERPVGALPLLGEAEHHLLLREWNDTGSARQAGIVGRFREWAARAPAALAVAGDGLAWSYGELAQGVSRLAQALRGLGVGPEVPVGVLTGRRPEVALAFLAVLEAGGAYLPLDPELPPERLGFMLRDAGAAVVVTTAAAAARARLAEWAGGVPAIEVGAAAGDGAGGPPAPAAGESAADGENLAYVIYTSGSSGQPKAVGITRRSLLNLLLWQGESCALAPGDRASQTASLGFDVSVAEILAPFLAGASLHLPAAEEVRDPARLGAWLSAQRITVAILTTAVFHALLDHGLPPGLALRRLLVGGEALRPVERQLPFALVNVYGPTEGTVVATGGAVRCGGPAAPPPIGRPLPGVRAVVVEPRGEPAPPGVAGELCLGGEGVARGYLKRPDLTAERFVPDPWADRPGSRAYRTGDRVRALADGRLEYLGRLDHQVKVRGFRVEPGEIEAALREHPAVRAAVVVDRRAAGAVSELRLVAYVVAADGVGGNGSLAPALRRHLEARLPAYMVPAAIVRLDAFPLSAHGKVDHRALRAMPLPGAALRPAEVAFVAPRNATEGLVARVWREVLGIDTLGIDDPFFDVGGSSLSIAVAANLLESALKRPVPVLALFHHPTVRSLAEHLAGGDPLGEARLLEGIGQQAQERIETRELRRQRRGEHRF